MSFRRAVINLNLVWVLFLAAGCASMNKKKEQPMLGLHLEASSIDTNRSILVPIIRSNPVQVLVEKSAFVTEQDVVRAQLREISGAFSIELELNSHGTRYLEIMTARARGKRVAVIGGVKTYRWLAAVELHQVVSNGRFSFFPDATREEAKQLVDGLNQKAAERNKSKLF